MKRFARSSALIGCPDGVLNTRSTPSGHALSELLSVRTSRSRATIQLCNLIGRRLRARLVSEKHHLPFSLRMLRTTLIVCRPQSMSCPRLLNRQSLHFVSWLLRYFKASRRILTQQAPLQGLLHCRFQHNVRVADCPSGQIVLAQLPIHGLEIQRSHSRQNSFTQIRSDVPPQHALVVLVSFLSYSRSHRCLKPAVKILVQCDLRPLPDRGPSHALSVSLLDMPGLPSYCP